MPGIAGIISQRDPFECRELLEQMLAPMAHEPFYVGGSLHAPECGSYAGWWAHPGSFAAKHSGWSRFSQVGTAFTGECFGSASDGTDSRDDPVQSYISKPESFPHDLNGQFAGLLIDRPRKRSFLFNDRLSAERIYVHETSEELFFASEAKALLAVLPGSRVFDDEGIAQYLAYGCTLNTTTLFKGIATLAPGTLLTANRGERAAHKRYFDISDLENSTQLDEDAYASEFARLFDRILPRYLNSSESIGLSLTGGLDTRMIAAGAGPSSSCVTSYTFGPEHDRLRDLRIARKIANACGLPHEAVRLGSDFLSDYRAQLDKTVFVTDGAAGPLASHEIFLNARARALAHVRLTGNFGSEVLRAASTFKPVGIDPSVLSERWKGVAAEATLRENPADGLHPVTFSLTREIPWNLYGTMAAARSQIVFRTPYLDNEIVRLAYRIGSSYRKSPRAALRYISSRSPRLAAIPTDRGRSLSAGVFRQIWTRSSAEVTFKLDYYHKEGLPSPAAWIAPALDAFDALGILGGHKFLAYRRWFQRELLPVVEETVRQRNVLDMPFWNPSEIKGMVSRHRRGIKNHIREISAILAIESIDRLLLRRSYSRSTESVPVVPTTEAAHA